jgi:hypothetical protein
MGGGGGAGTTNNATGSPGSGFASSGSAGGGIIILFAQNAITGAGTIKANGTAANSTVLNDGSGGGGAGGSVLIYSNNGITSNLTVQAKGGNGGSNQVSVAGGASHGPGGGGGGGVVYSNGTLNVASTINAGNAGMTANMTTNYGATNGSNGIIVATMSQSDPASIPLHCITLPTSFLSLTATNGNGSVDLSWAVTREVNTLKYIVERSTDGVNFSAIGSLFYKEGNALNNVYQYSDNALPAAGGNIYYRIRELDTDGQFVYSKIVVVQLNTLSGKLAVYPNPAQNSITASFTCTNAAQVSLRLFDLKGSVLWQQLYKAVIGRNTVSIDHIRNLPAGVYILQWFDGLKPEQVKIMVDR